ncbi:22789_t:CDS:1, partial [Gigaspora margarita]
MANKKNIELSVQLKILASWLQEVGLKIQAIIIKSWATLSARQSMNIIVEYVSDQ